jgi:hypothetical protein
MRDEDEDTARLRFGARRDDKPSLWKQERDREDMYWCPPQAACIKCGAVDYLPRGVEYDEYLCSDCQEKSE